MQLGAVKIDEKSIICSMGNDSGEIISNTVYSLETPEEITETIIEYFRTKHPKGISIALSKNIENAWGSYDILTPLKEALKFQVFLFPLADAVILGELTFGSCKGIKNCICMLSGEKGEIGVISDGKQIKNVRSIELTSINVDKLLEDYNPEKIVTEVDDIICLKGAFALIRKVL